MDRTSYIEDWLEGPGGHRFYTRTYPAKNPRAPRAVVIFVHGFADHISRYAEFHAKWPLRNITVFAYDLRGFGRTAMDARHCSSDAGFGKTSASQEKEDLEWWIYHVSHTYPHAPIFLLGHSMGGAVVLSFASRKERSSSTSAAISLVSGVIANGPLLQLAEPVPKIIRAFAAMLADIFPHCPFPARMPESRFSRDPAVCEALLHDPLRKFYGRARGLVDMLNQGEQLLFEGWRYWPDDMPVLSTWGTADKASSLPAGLAFHERLPIRDKRLLTYDGALHDLFHETFGISHRLFEDCVSWVEEHLR